MYKLEVRLIPPKAREFASIGIIPSATETSSILGSNAMFSMSQEMFPSNIETSSPYSKLNNGVNKSVAFSPMASLTQPLPRIKKFLHFTKPTNSLLELSREILAKCEKMYPNLVNEIEILSLQDSAGCDLDPDFIVKDVFNLDNVVRVILKDELEMDESANVSVYSVRNGNKRMKLLNGSAANPPVEQLVPSPSQAAPTGGQSGSASNNMIQIKKRPPRKNSLNTSIRVSTPLVNQIYPSYNNVRTSNNSDEEDEVAERSFLPPPAQPQSPPIRISSGIDNTKRIKLPNEDTVSRSETVDPDKSRQQRIFSGTPMRNIMTPNRVMLTGQRVVSEYYQTGNNNNPMNSPSSTPHGLVFTSTATTNPTTVPQTLSAPSSGVKNNVMTTPRITSGMLSIPEPRISEVEKELKEGPSSPSSALPAKANRIPMKRPYNEKEPIVDTETSSSEDTDDFLDFTTSPSVRNDRSTSSYRPMGRNKQTRLHTRLTPVKDQSSHKVIEQKTATQSNPQSANNSQLNSERKISIESKIEKKPSGSFSQGIHGDDMRRIDHFSDEDDYSDVLDTDRAIVSRTTSSDSDQVGNDTVRYTHLTQEMDGNGVMERGPITPPVITSEAREMQPQMLMNDSVKPGHTWDQSSPSNNWSKPGKATVLDSSSDTTAKGITDSSGISPKTQIPKGKKENSEDFIKQPEPSGETRGKELEAKAKVDDSTVAITTEKPTSKRNQRRKSVGKTPASTPAAAPDSKLPTTVATRVKVTKTEPLPEDGTIKVTKPLGKRGASSEEVLPLTKTTESNKRRRKGAKDAPVSEALPSGDSIPDDGKSKEDNKKKTTEGEQNGRNVGLRKPDGNDDKRMESDKVAMEQPQKEKEKDKKVLGKPTSTLRKPRAADVVGEKPSVLKGSTLSTSNSPGKSATTSGSSGTKNKEEVADSKEKKKSRKEAKNSKVVDSSEESTDSSYDSSSSESSESDDDDSRDTGANRTKSPTAAREGSSKVQNRRNQVKPVEGIAHSQIGNSDVSKQQEKLHSKEFQTSEVVLDESDDSVEKIQDAGKSEADSLTAPKKSVAAAVNPRNDLTEVNVKTVEGTEKHKAVGKAVPHSQLSPANKKGEKGSSVLAKSGTTRRGTSAKNPPAPPSNTSKPIIEGQNDLNKNIGGGSTVPPKLALSMPGKVEVGINTKTGTNSSVKGVSQGEPINILSSSEEDSTETSESSTKSGSSSSEGSTSSDSDSSSESESESELSSSASDDESSDETSSSSDTDSSGSSSYESTAESSSDEEDDTPKKVKRMVVAIPKGRVQSRNSPITTTPPVSIPVDTKKPEVQASDNRKADKIPDSTGRTPTPGTRMPVDTPKDKSSTDARASGVGKNSQGSSSGLLSKARSSLSSLSDLASKGIPDVKERGNKGQGVKPSPLSRQQLAKRVDSQSEESSGSSESETGSETDSTSDDDSSSGSSSSDESSGDSDSDEGTGIFISAKSAGEALGKRKKKRSSNGFASLVRDSQRG